MTPHLRLSSSMLRGSTIALVPGDPGRVPRIAAHMSDATELASNREYVSALGYVKGRPVVVCSSGIGGPATAICVEELAQVGIRTIIRVGTTGAIQKGIALGDAIICTAAVRLEGTSQHFAPLEFPAVANFQVTTALVRAAEELGKVHHVGIGVSSDTFYPGQERYDTYSGRVLSRFAGSLAMWQQLGALNYEMEAASIFVVCQALGLKAGCILGVVAQRTVSENLVGIDADVCEESAISLALAAIARL